MPGRERIRNAKTDRWFANKIECGGLNRKKAREKKNMRCKDRHMVAGWPRAMRRANSQEIQEEKEYKI